jgi:hypothetical protein
MMSSQKLLWIAAFLLCISAARLYGEVPEESRCFTIHVRLNGKPIAGPKMLTFKTREVEKSASAEGACFKVPPALLHEKDVDVLFIVPGNKVYLSTIPTAFLAGSWDIDLADRRFGRDVVLPRHTRTKEACAVIFHVGEPETARTLSGCRTTF